MLPARPHRRSPAFTLLELLTVMAVVLVLSGLAITGVSGARLRADLARARSDLAALATALEEFKRLYGDYPQLGEFAQAPAVPTTLAAGPGINSAQAKLFNCLTGVFGPRGFGNPDRLNGPSLLPPQFADVKHLNGALATTYQVVSASATGPLFKQEQNVCILDPWGRRYVYYYKTVRNPGGWQAPAYLLFSAGPDGAFTAPPNTGVYTAAQLVVANNADNLYATTP